MKRSWRAACAALAASGLLLGLPSSVAGTEVGTPAEGLPADAPPAALTQEPTLPVPEGWPFPDAFPRTSGTGRLMEGSLQWSDFVYDDFGARGGRNQSVTPLSVSRGSYSYPDGDRYQRNGADLFRIGIGTDDSATYWRVEWTTMVDPTVPIVSFAFDTDASDTGSSSWSTVPNLKAAGIDRELVVSAQGAWLVDTASGARTSVGDLGGTLTVDTAARTFVARIPHAALKPEDTWRVWAVSGLADEDGTGFEPVPPNRGGLPGVLPPVYNVGFRTHLQEWLPDSSAWAEGAQAHALLLGDVTEFAADVDWAELAAGTTTPEPKPAGFQNRWYVTSAELGQGVIPSADFLSDARPNFLGRIQPYFAYVPTSYDETKPVPLRFILHAFGTNHNQYSVLSPDYIRQACEDWGAICVTTLGRGPDGMYRDEAELDFWEVWNRVAADYRLDPESTSLSGYSMGGFGTSRFSQRYPDLFARTAILAGAGGDTPELENLRWVPTFLAHGALDQLLLITEAEAMADALDALGYRYRYEMYPAEEHIAYALKDGFSTAAEWMADHTRAVDPGHVSLTWSPETDRPDLGFAITGAYWIRDVVVRDTDARARFEGRSSARPQPEVTETRSKSLAVPGDPSPAVVRELAWELGDVGPTEPAITLDLDNIEGLSVQLARAGIAPGTTAEIAVTSSEAVALTLNDLAPGTKVLIDGRRVAIAGGQRSTTVELPAGATQLVLRKGPAR